MLGGRVVGIAHVRCNTCVHCLKVALARFDIARMHIARLLGIHELLSSCSRGVELANAVIVLLVSVGGKGCKRLQEEVCGSCYDPSGQLCCTQLSLVRLSHGASAGAIL